MADFRRRSDDDAAWSDLEQGFFASAPPDVPEPPEAPPSFDDLLPTEPPRPVVPAWLRRAAPSIASAKRHAAKIAAAAWRRSTLALAATREPIRRQVRALAARFVAALSTGRRYRPVITYALASAILVMGLSAGIVAPPNEAVTNPPTAPVGPPADVGGEIAIAQPTPLGPLPSPAASKPPARSSAQSRPRRSETPKQPARPHRMRRPAPSSARDLMRPTFILPGAQPTVERRPTPVPATRPFFSR